MAWSDQARRRSAEVRKAKAKAKAEHPVYYPKTPGSSLVYIPKARRAKKGSGLPVIASLTALHGRNPFASPERMMLHTRLDGQIDVTYRSQSGKDMVYGTYGNRRSANAAISKYERMARRSKRKLTP